MLLANSHQKNDRAKTRRVLLIGLDGATFDFITPWAEDGSLPTFRKIMDDGVHGPLRSTIPPVTPPAWTSMVTGTNPGKHGVFHFYDLEALPEKLTVVNSTYRKNPALWNILTESDKSSIVLNVPTTYPVEEIKGIMVSGFMTPPKVEDFIYPPSLRDEFNKKGYQIGPRYGFSGHLAIEEIEKRIHDRTEAALWLMENQTWDFFMVVFRAPDIVAHRFINNIDNIRRVYQQCDKAIETLLNAAPDNTITLITSDHGTGYIYTQFLINNWLLNRGYIQLKSKQASGKGRRSLKSRLIRFIIRIEPLRRLLRKLPATIRGVFRPSVTPSPTDIDPSRSIAWCPGAKDNFSFIDIGNIQNTQDASYTPDQAISNLLSKLSDVKDPKSGKAIVRTIHETKDVMSGNLLSNAPPYILETYEEVAAPSFFTFDRIDFKHFTKPISSHQMDGIFLAFGNGIASKNVEEFHPVIWDVTPTVLNILDVPPPPNLDGRVLREIFLDPELKERDLKPKDVGVGERQQRKLSKEEQNKIMERLEELGYA